MPKLEIAGHGRIEAEPGERLVLAVGRAGVDVGHRCGGWAKCTTCRVRFVSGEPERMTAAERDKLEEKGELGNFRLSCQIPVETDMEVEVLMRASEQGWPDPGPPPEPGITPEPEWVEAPG